METIDLIIHGVPYGHQTTLIEEEYLKGYFDRFYDNSVTDKNLSVYKGEHAGSNSTIYTVCHGNAADSNGRGGSYIGMSVIIKWKPDVPKPDKVNEQQVINALVHFFHGQILPQAAKQYQNGRYQWRGDNISHVFPLKNLYEMVHSIAREILPYVNQGATKSDQLQNAIRKLEQEIAQMEQSLSERRAQLAQMQKQLATHTDFKK